MLTIRPLGLIYDRLFMPIHVELLGPGPPFFVNVQWQA